MSLSSSCSLESVVFTEQGYASVYATTEHISATRVNPDLAQIQLITFMESQTKPSTSSSGLPHLPDDVHVDILKRLPVTSLVRFRCVSNSWRSLIADPIFVQMELDFHFKTRTRVILSRYLRTIISVGPEELTPSPNHVHDAENVNGFEIAQQLDLPSIPGHNYNVKGHCDGLLCVIFIDGTIVLWNPSIREYRTLPKPCNFRNTREVLGLGFDSSTNDYKIVRAPSAYCKCKVKDYHPQVEVLSLSSNSWRKLPDEVTPPYFIEHIQQSITVNSGLYWLTFEDFVSVILRFDLAEETFKLVPQPPEVDRNISWMGVLKGSLCVTHSQKWSYFDIWMTKNDSTWAKLITINKCRPDSYRSSADYKPLCFTKSGALLVSIQEKGLMIYEPRLRYYRKLKVLEDQRWSQETVYAETLVSPHGLNGATSLGQQQPTDLACRTDHPGLLQLLIGLIHMPCNLFRWFS